MNEDLKNYFKEMFVNVDKNIELDEDQINAIVNDDKYVLVLAGAGTGKTTTMVAKVKYLVDIKKINPSRILVISYTKKAVQELETLIIDRFGINTNVSTFHSLAYKYIREIFKNRKCAVIDYNKKEEIFYNFINVLFKQNKIEDLVETFNKETLNNNNFFYGKYFLDNYNKYSDYGSFFEKYKEYKLEEAHKVGIEKVIDEWVLRRLTDEDAIITIKGELVKSAGEAIIANFLFRHGIDYEYEKIYSEIVEDRKIYKPDFTLNLAGENVYLEYFGLDDYKYNRIKERKIKLHDKYNNKFIYLETLPLKDIERELEKKLKIMGFVFRDKSNDEIYNQILDNNKFSQIYNLKNLFYESVNSIKESLDRENYNIVVENYINTLESEEKEKIIKQWKYLKAYYLFYLKKSYDSDIYYFDYSDLIYYTNKYYNDVLSNNSIYDYVIVDEYQDISDGEYELARKTSKLGNSKVFAVGDDWQSIYSFRGSKIKYITKFGLYFENPTILSIKNTYRNSQELIDMSKEFIEKNKDQISKNMISFKHLYKPIHFIKYDDRIDGSYVDATIEYKYLKELILKIHELAPDHSILILGRTNEIINNCFKYDSDFIDDLGTKIRLATISDLDLDGMTIHKAKGLTYDEVIIIGMNKLFPRESISQNWLIDLFKQKAPEESIPYAEERRLFYVALTRTKNNVFILFNENTKNRSKFVDEFVSICKSNEK